MAKPNVAEEVEDRPDGLSTFESKLVNLLALQLVQERKQPDQISLLNRAGFRPIEIAALLGTTPNTVRVEMSNQKREKKRTTKRKTKK
jgi:hypothetical protein